MRVNGWGDRRDAKRLTSLNYSRRVRLQETNSKLSRFVCVCVCSVLVCWRHGFQVRFFAMCAKTRLPLHSLSVYFDIYTTVYTYVTYSYVLSSTIEHEYSITKLCHKCFIFQVARWKRKCNLNFFILWQNITNIKSFYFRSFWVIVRSPSSFYVVNMHFIIKIWMKSNTILY